MGVKKLGFGLMRLPLLDKNDDTGIDIEQPSADGGQYRLHGEF